MKAIFEKYACYQSQRLISYIYGEMPEADSLSFAEHLNLCAVCTSELADFIDTRGSIAEWRSLVTSSASSTIPVRKLKPARAPERNSARPSAFEHLRAFFSLTPVWVKIAGAMAALALCVLATLALVNGEISARDGRIAFRTGVEHPGAAGEVHEVVAPSSFSQEQIDKLVAERVREVTEAQRNSEQSRIAGAVASAMSQVTLSKQNVRVPAHLKTGVSHAVTASAHNGNLDQGRFQPQYLNARDYRTQLADGVSPDEALPRLSDLLTEVDN